MYVKLIYLINFMIFMGIMTYLSYWYGIYLTFKHFEKNVWHITFMTFGILGTIFFSILFGVAFFIPV
jgi:hypothetical protein